jgi:hypothetical protein
MRKEEDKVREFEVVLYTFPSALALLSRSGDRWRRDTRRLDFDVTRLAATDPPTSTTASILIFDFRGFWSNPRRNPDAGAEAGSMAETSCPAARLDHRSLRFPREFRVRIPAESRGGSRKCEAIVEIIIIVITAISLIRSIVRREATRWTRI